MEQNRQLVIAVIGGDTRQAYLANMLALDGYCVITAALEKLEEVSASCFIGSVGEAIASADILILPMPVSKDGVTLIAPYSYNTVYLNDIWASADRTRLILGGKIHCPPQSKLHIMDYADREELAVRNAVPTAEAALEIAIRETDITLFGSTCAVIGYGRIGKVLSRLLSGFGARVIATARKRGDLAWIEAEGFTARRTADLHEYIGEADVIFNTVPDNVITRREIVACKRSALIIDLASAPGRTDFAAAEQNGIKAISALSLPGKTAPVSAARIVKDTVTAIFREEGFAV